MKAKVLFLLGVVVCSCSQERTEIVFDDKELNETSPEDIMIEHHKTDVNFVRPTMMDFVLDSLLVIFDNKSGDEVCFIMNKQGEKKASFGRKGRSREELIQAKGISISLNRDSVYVYDSQLMKFVGFDLKKELAGVEYEKKVLETGNVAEKNNLGATWIMDARYLTDNQFIGFGNDANRLISVSGKTVKETYQEFPNIDADQETNWSIWNNMSKFCVSPDKEKLVISTYIGSMIQIFNISGGIRPKALKTFYKPMYSYAQGATPKCVISNEQTIFGSQSLYTCPKSFLVNIAGTNHKFDEILFRYDYDGKIQTSYNIGRVPMCMCLDDSGNLYFLADDKDAEEIQLYTGTL